MLFRSQEGTQTINGITATVAVPTQRNSSQRWPFDNDFFGAAFGMANLEQKHATSDDLILTVKPLPKHDNPVHGIGSFSSLHAGLSAHEATVGEPLVLTLTIEGKANLDALATPKLTIPASFKYYDSKNATHQNLSSDFNSGKKVFEFILQANRDGQFEIPPQTFTFYDHIAQSYKTLTTTALPVTIKPSTSQPPIQIGRAHV